MNLSEQRSSDREVTLPVVFPTRLSRFPREIEVYYTTDKHQTPKLIKLVGVGASQYYTYSPDRHVYRTVERPSSALNEQTDYRCVVTRFQNFKSDKETIEIFWTLFGGIVGYDSVPVVCVENVKGQKMVFVSFTDEEKCNVIIETFNDCPFMRVQKKKKR